MKPGESFPAACDRLQIDFIYFDEASYGCMDAGLERTGGGAFLDLSPIAGWRLIDSGNDHGDRWRLYGRE
jgi:hypothetical protein